MRTRTEKRSRVLAAAVCIFLFPSSSYAGDWASKPHLGRSGSNLLPNPRVNGMSGWTTSGDAVYSSTVSRGSGTGSINLKEGGKILGELIPVTPDKEYTFAAYVRSETFPPPVLNFRPSWYDSSGSYINHVTSRYQDLSAAGQWQETVTIVVPDDDVAFIRPEVWMKAIRDEGGDEVWLDDFYLGEGIGFQQPPSPKQPFNGAQVRIDELGNFEILRGDIWEPFFPLGICLPDARPDWGVVSRQGFNVVTWAHSHTQVQRAKDATSSFNPDGMMAGIAISRFTNPASAYYNNLPMLEDVVNGIKNAGLSDRVIMYYWDNENSYGEWSVFKDVTDKIKELDVDAHGNRLRPIWQLQGNEGMARTYLNANVSMSDITGDYVSGNVSIAPRRNLAGTSHGLVIQDNIEGQIHPVSFAQINLETGLDFRPVLYHAIATGARGMSFWRDYYTATSNYPKLETTAWWPDFPNLRREIDQLLPLIRQPHWTSWKATSSNSSVGFSFGTRDFDGEGYLIVSNTLDSTQTTTFTLSGLAYVPTEVRDYFTDSVVASFSGNSFTASVRSNGSAVWRLVR